MSKKSKGRDNRIVTASMYANRMTAERQRLDELKRLIAEREARLQGEAKPRRTFLDNLHPAIRPSDVARTDRRLYFAYGSNLDRAQMKLRCPGATALYGHYLAGFTLEFQRYANVVEASEEDTVPGVIYLITPEDEAALDRFEGVAKGSYRKRTFKFFTPRGNWRNVLFYQKKPGRLIPPTRDYLALISAGLQRWELDGASLALAVEAARAADLLHVSKVQANVARITGEDDDSEDEWNGFDEEWNPDTMPVDALRDALSDPTYGFSDDEIEQMKIALARKEKM